MTDSDVTRTPAAMTGRACLVDGCPCKDARILSRRRAAYVAAVARSRGETASRVFAVDPGWRIPSPTGG
jgi:hypothetical protein